MLARETFEDVRGFPFPALLPAPASLVMSGDHTCLLGVPVGNVIPWGPTRHPSEVALILQ